jgi:hypothetical protein
VISAGDLLHAEVSVFTEEAVARGIDYEVVMPVEAAGLGFSFADLDSDGDADLVAIGRTDGGIGLWENDGTGHFVDRSEGSGLPVLTAPSGVIAGDYDGDADLDLYFSNYLVANTLMRNDGGFTFTDVSAASRTEDEGRGTGCAWGDFDRDGWLDLYVANNIPGSGLNTYPNLLYRNEGTGQFEDVLEQVGMFDDSKGETTTSRPSISPSTPAWLPASTRLVSRSGTSTATARKISIRRTSRPATRCT